MSHTRLTTLAFLLLELSYFVLFEKISCPLCILNTLWNISTVLGRNVEQDQTMCLIQEWQLCLSYFWRYLPLLYLTLIMHWFSVRSVSRTLFGIFWWYLVVMKNRTRRHVTYKNDNFSFFLLLELSPLLVFEFDFLSLLCNTNTLRNILMMLGTNVEQDDMMCCIQEWQPWRDWGVQAVWNQGVDDLIKFWSELCPFSFLALVSTSL